MGKKIEKHNYSAKLVRVVDGDTCDALIDLGFDTWVKKRIRFKGVDTWESRTRNKEEKVKGLAAKARLIELMDNADNEFILLSNGVGKFGRCLGELLVDGKSVNKKLIEEGHATEYDGGKR